MEEMQHPLTRVSSGAQDASAALADVRQAARAYMEKRELGPEAREGWNRQWRNDVMDFLAPPPIRRIDQFPDFIVAEARYREGREVIEMLAGEQDIPVDRGLLCVASLHGHDGLLRGLAGRVRYIENGLGEFFAAQARDYVESGLARAVAAMDSPTHAARVIDVEGIIPSSHTPPL